MILPGRRFLSVSLVLFLLSTSNAVRAASPTVVISQIYGGGGNSGALLKNDFVELFNRGSAPADLTGWSFQYTSAGETTWQVTSLTGSIAPGHYFLIQEAAGSAGTIDLPAANAIGTIGMSATDGKVALVNSSAALSGGCPVTDGTTSVVDFVGYGTANCFEGTAAAPKLSNTTSALRGGDGANETDSNSDDFAPGTPAPRNDSFVPLPPLVLAIHDIQGGGSRSPYAGRAVLTTGIVTAVKNSGFFIQVPDDEVDADPNTSEGVFVFTSSAPRAPVVAGAKVSVKGVVSEFVPSSDPSQPPLTEISSSPTVTLISSGNPLPAPVTLQAADTPPSGTPEQLERLEGMRIHVDSLTTVSASLGSVNEANATGTSNGVFYAVVTGVPRPYREPGVDILDPLPTGAPCCIPRFDGNPERLRVDSIGQTGATRLDVTSNATVVNVTGVLDYGFRTYTILPDPGAAPMVFGGMSAVPVPEPSDSELVISSFNMERFFDTVDDPGTSDVALTPAAFANRLNKASLAIRNVMRSPDVIGVEEVENIGVIQAIAAKLNSDTVAGGHPDPGYEGFLFEGNDPGGIDSGVLVKTSRVRVVDVVQFGKDDTYINPANGMPETLNDRPPVVLRAGIGALSFTVIVNHLRSFDGIDGPDGLRIRSKRRAQAEFLANLIQSFQTADPEQKIISVGDYNAYEFSDGYVDTIGTITGNPAPPTDVLLPSADLVHPGLTDLVNTISFPGERYSYVFDGNAQVLDHVLVSQNMMPLLTRFAYARNDADFPETLRNDASRPERASDHDMPVAYFALPDQGGGGGPRVSASPSPAVLWPPDHRLVDVSVHVNVTDDDDAAPECSIVDVASNERIRGAGAGKTRPDWRVRPRVISGTGTLHVRLRAERGVRENTDRIYTVVVGCSDKEGKSATKPVTVTVPLSGKDSR